jgi:hypothetical protein
LDTNENLIGHNSIIDNNYISNQLNQSQNKDFSSNKHNTNKSLLQQNKQRYIALDVLSQPIQQPKRMFFPNGFIICELCDLLIPKDLMINLNECNHSFCSRCAQNYYEDKIETGTDLNFTCPYYYCKTNIPETLLKKLISNYKSLNDQLNAVSTRLIEISEIWTDLLKTAMEYSDEQYVISTYQLMSKVTRDWAELEKKQAALTNIDIREYFKNINKQSHCLKELSIKAEGHKNNFYKQQEKLLSKKEELFRQQNIDKWGIDNKDTTIDKGRLTSDKEYAFMKMLVKETEVVDNLKLNFGFYMNRTIEEYERVRTLNGVNHSNAIATYCQKHTAVIADLSTSLADIVAFLGDGTYLKEVVIEEKVKLGVRPVEKQNVKEDKNEEQQTQQQNEERNVDDTNNTNQDQQGNGEEIEETNMNENKAYGEEYIDNEGN